MRELPPPTQLRTAPQASLRSVLGLVGRVVLDAALPPRCLSCGVIVRGSAGVCGPCWRELAFIGTPCCARCGLPFAVNMGAEGLCASCAKEPSPITRGRAALVYDDRSKPLILAFKHADRLDMAPVFARWLAGAAGPSLANADLIVPVPLHWTRLLHRRYNQAAELGRALSAGSGKPYRPDALLRRRRTPQLGGLSRAQRQRAVAGAFAVHREAAVALQDARILLVDDVNTTGATLAACARCLVRAGAARVDAVTIARVAPSG